MGSRTALDHWHAKASRAIVDGNFAKAAEYFEIAADYAPTYELEAVERQNAREARALYLRPPVADGTGQP
jgi:hypothetical protein